MDSSMGDNLPVVIENKTLKQNTVKRQDANKNEQERISISVFYKSHNTNAHGLHFIITDLRVVEE